MRAQHLRQIFAVAVFMLLAAALPAHASAQMPQAQAGERSPSALVATVDSAPVSHLVEPRDESSGGRAKAARGPLLLLALLVVLSQAARRWRRTGRPYRFGARHRSDRWTVSLRGPPASFS